jgi:hypothetical protein
MATSGNYSKGGFRVAFTAGGTTAGDMAAVLNPTGEALVITKTIVNITIDVGIAANGTTSNDTLIDGLSGATAGVFSTPGTNGLPTKLWGATEYLTVSEASGDVTGIVGEVILQFLTR